MNFARHQQSPIFLKDRGSWRSLLLMGVEFVTGLCVNFFEISPARDTRHCDGTNAFPVLPILHPAEVGLSRSHNGSVEAG